jgi:hypothetical protein
MCVSFHLRFVLFLSDLKHIGFGQQVLLGIFYRDADKFLARPTSRCICLMVRIFRLMLVLLHI